MAEKCPLRYPLYRNARALSPIHLAEDSSEMSGIRFRKLLELFVSGNQISIQYGQDAKKEFSHFVQNVVKNNKKDFLECDISAKDQRIGQILL